MFTECSLNVPQVREVTMNVDQSHKRRVQAIELKAKEALDGSLKKKDQWADVTNSLNPKVQLSSKKTAFQKALVPSDQRKTSAEDQRELSAGSAKRSNVEDQDNAVRI
jgi:hypothetical protein